ncbi:MAG: hypothetical protein WKF97_08100 [Chitinophagaceae bacterium]
MKATFIFLILFCFATTGRPQHQPIISTKDYVLASAMLRFRTTCYDSSPVVFVNVHENESTSVRAWLQVMNAPRQHCLVECQHEKLRLISFIYKKKKYRIDPNRIFTTAGSSATLKKYNDTYDTTVISKVNQLSAFVISSFIKNKKLVVALHNNTEGRYSIKSYLPNGEEAINAAEVHLNGQKDSDDFFYTTERIYFDFLKNKGCNVALQSIAKATDDGSLSVYCAQNKIPYINIEAQDGHLAEQSEMIKTVDELIRFFKIR